MKNKAKWFQITYGLSVFFASIILLINIVYKYGSGDTTVRFTLIYGGLAVVGVVLGAVILFYDYYKKVQEETPVGSAFFVAETDEAKPLSVHPAIQVGAFLFLTLMIAFASFGTGQLIPVTNPYGADTLSTDVLSQHSFGENFVYVGLYPGLMEELPVFILVSLLTFLLMQLACLINKELKGSMVAFIPSAFISSLIGAWMFTKAHGVSYGQDGSAYVSAFVFEGVVQFFNQMTGFFGSWLPHLVHNVMFSLGLVTAFSIGGVVALTIFVPVWIKNRKQVINNDE